MTPIASKDIRYASLQYKFVTYFGLGSFCQAICIAMAFIVLLLMVMTDFGLKLLIKVQYMHTHTHMHTYKYVCTLEQTVSCVLQWWYSKKHRSYKGRGTQVEIRKFYLH